MLSTSPDVAAAAWSAARIAAAIIGAAGLSAALRAMAAARAVRRWPTTSGAVVARGTGRVSAANLGSPAFQHTPLVRYRYTVDGETLEGTTWYPATVHRPPRGTLAWATRQADAVPDVVPVAYDPANPASAYLVPVPEWRLALAAGLSGVLFLVACLGGE